MKPTGGGRFDPDEEPIFFMADNRIVKATGGGRFDPKEDPVFFLAGTQFMQLYKGHPYNLVALNDLASGGIEKEDDGEGGSPLDHFDRLLDSDNEVLNKVLLDSGVFWLTNKHMRAHPPMTMNDALSLPPDQIDGFDWLWSNYVSVVKRFEDRLWGYIELDQGGAVNKRITRAKLEAEGLNPMPVYHPMNDGWDYFDELASQYDRICVGNIVQANNVERRHLLATFWERRRHYPHLWIHILGITPNEITTVYPQSSYDSSKWVYAVRFGASTTAASSLNDAFDNFDASFTYVPGDRKADAGYTKGNRWLASEHRFQHEVMRAHVREQREVFGAQSICPPPDRAEKVRCAA